MSLVLSKKYNYIFFHLPKNAGVSISNALINEEYQLIIKKFSQYLLKHLKGKKNNFHFSLDNRDFFFFNSHITCYDFYKLISKKEFENSFKFAVIRNPWDRMVSRYFYSKKVSNYFVNFSFEDFVEYDIKNNQKVLNQFEFCTVDRSNFCLNSFIRFENINDDFSKIYKNIFDKSTKLKNMNSTYHDDYKKYYNTKLKDKIYKNFKKDINFFEYEY